MGVVGETLRESAIINLTAAVTMVVDDSAFAAELFHQLDFVGALQVRNGAEAALQQLFLGRRPDAIDEADRVASHGERQYHEAARGGQGVAPPARQLGGERRDLRIPHVQVGAQ